MKIYCPQCKKIITPELPDGAQEVNCPECSTAIPVPENDLAPGVVIGDFLLEKPLSSGGMGMVYLARQISLDRPVALKVLHDKFADNPEYIEGLFREARAAAKLTHPNIVQAYAVGEENGIFYFAMEYIRGETFKQILKRQNILEFDQAVKVIKEICGALHAAWNEQKLVHQDIKPDNIMLDSNGFAKLADLGLARSANTDSGLAEDETEVMGTPQYISPEQLTGVPTDVRSDIYSLGATFYQFVTGQFPYPEESAEAMARKHVEGNLTPPKDINPELPQQLNDIIVKMMARHIEDRYQTPADIIKDLDAYSLKTASVAIPKLSLNFSPNGAAKGKSPLLPPKFGPTAGTTAKPGTAPKIGVPGTTAKPAAAMPKALA
ncbi:MAG: protein kinase, partial [Lentisphaeria bacterium]|nr:protein kinase [Lentisphaeria bacterium]